MAEKQTFKRVKKNNSEQKNEKKESVQKKSNEKKSAQSKAETSTKRSPEPQNDKSSLAIIITFTIIGLIIFLSIIVDIVSHINGETVIIGHLTKPIMGLFGICTPFIGAYSLVFAYFCQKYRLDSYTKTVKGILLFFNVFFLLGILHLINGFWTDIPISAKSFWSFGINWKGCGVIGGYIGWFLGKLLHKSIGLIFGLLAYFFCVILFFDGSPLNVSKGMGRKTKSFFKFTSKKIKQKIENVKESKAEAEAKSESEKVSKETEEKEKKAEKNPHIIPKSQVSESSKDVHSQQAVVQKNRTENYVTGSIYDAPIRKELPKEENEDNLSSEKVKNRFGFKMGREARDEDPNAQTEETNTDVSEPEADEFTEGIEDINGEKNLVSPEDELPEYIYPPIELLEKGSDEAFFDSSEVEEKKHILLATLEAFKVKADVVNISCGPTITRYEIEPEMGVSVKSIEKLGKDLAMRLAAKSLRIEAPIPGKCAVGIEVSNNDRLTVKLRDILDSPVFRENKSKLFCCLGVDVAGNAVYLDIPKMPHLLIAGATGMGKSVCLNCLIISLIFRASPKDVRLILIDPKKVEFSHYSDIPHLLAPVVTNINKCAATLSWAVSTMEERYDIFESLTLRNLEEYHAYTADNPEAKKLPYIVIVIDELADLMMQVGAEVENYICRLAQKARAAGIYLILGTQRPSVDVITGLIKANIPSRISLAVTSQVDSRTILDTVGAESLLDKGDILFAPAGARKALRVQGAFISTKELNSICDFIRTNSTPLYDKEVVENINNAEKQLGKNKKNKSESDEKPETDSKDMELMIAALEVGFEQGTISTSYIQRRLSFGYARAARVVDMLQQNGFVTPPDPTTKLRKIIISPQELAELKLNGKITSHKENTEDEE